MSFCLIIPVLNFKWPLVWLYLFTSLAGCYRDHVRIHLSKQIIDVSKDYICIES